MPTLGNPASRNATRMMLLGSGELGREVAIEAMRLGVHIIAVDRYPNAPAMQLAHESHVIDMLDGEALSALITKLSPDYIVPELEAIATHALVELEEQGHNVVPSARAVHFTMDRTSIRRLAAEELGLPTSPYGFADTPEEYHKLVEKIGIPCVVKPIMSSSGKGQTFVNSRADAIRAWEYAQEGGRTAGSGTVSSVIVEGFIDFDYEITLLTVRHSGGTDFCEPIGHRQENGDYRESWQPHPMSDATHAKARDIARRITDSLGGYGVYGVELFVKGEDVIFSEVSPRPHDTGMVTLMGQNLSQFALHARAILGLPVPVIRQLGPAATSVIMGRGDGYSITYSVDPLPLQTPDTSYLIFGKPEVHGTRRLGVALALGKDVEQAKKRAMRVSAGVTTTVR